MELVAGLGAKRVTRRFLLQPVVLRSAKREDCDAIYVWRNAPEVRRYSGDDREIDITAHHRWFNDSLVNPNRIYLIGEVQEQPIGVLRYDRMGHRATASVYLVPGRHGLGFGPELLKAGTQWLLKNWPEIEIIEAHILTRNRYSVKAFRSAGYSDLYFIFQADIRQGSSNELANREIGKNAPPFIKAEMSGNHNQSLDRALEIVEAAAKAGAHALKIQTYTADTMTLNVNEGEFFISDSKSLWNGSSLYSLYQAAYTPWEWHEPIFDRARKLGLIAFSTPFDETAVDFLESLNVPCYKIASFENADIPLIRKVAATGKPMIISTGMATIAELDEAVRVARQEGCNDLVLLKCTSTYPATPMNTNIVTIPHMRDLFGCDVGLSDHTMGIGVGVASVALGATVIEKHFSLRRVEGGVDAAFSVEPEEMSLLVSEKVCFLF